MSMYPAHQGALDLGALCLTTYDCCKSTARGQSACTSGETTEDSTLPVTGCAPATLCVLHSACREEESHFRQTHCC